MRLLPAVVRVTVRFEVPPQDHAKASTLLHRVYLTVSVLIRLPNQLRQKTGPQCYHAADQ